MKKKRFPNFIPFWQNSNGSILRSTRTNFRLIFILHGVFAWKIVNAYILEYTCDDTVIFPSSEILRELLSFYNIVTGHISMKRALASQLEGELSEKLNQVVKSCKKTPLHVKYLACNTANSLVVELSTIFFLFSQNTGKLKTLELKIFIHCISTCIFQF